MATKAPPAGSAAYAFSSVSIWFLHPNREVYIAHHHDVCSGMGSFKNPRGCPDTTAQLKMIDGGLCNGATGGKSKTLTQLMWG